MSATLPELRVEIDRLGANRYRSRAFDPAGGEICAHEFDFDPALLINIEAEEYLDKGIARDLNDVLRRPDAARGDARIAPLVAHGQRLFGYLFGDGAGLAAYLKHDPLARSRGARIVLALRPEAAALWGVPWEYLHDGREFLAVNGRFAVARMPWALRELKPAPTPLPLRILVIVSSPKNLPELNTEKEIADIQNALDDAIRDDKVRLDFLEEATLDSLQDALREVEPHVIHYMGHGAFGRLCARCGWLNHPRADACEGCRNDLENVEPTSYLALEDDEGRANNVGAQQIAPLLHAARNLRFVFLSSCQGARTNEFNAFAGVATGLLKEEIPAVLAMQYSILDESAIALAKAFYTALGRGDALEIALSDARLAMKNRADGPGADWGIPALYLRSHNLRLIDPSARVEKIETTQRLDIGGLPLPRGFVGRTEERREIRAALRERKTIYIRGIGGIGKSALVAKVLERPGVELDDALVIRCNEVMAAEIIGKVAAFLQGQGVAGHAQAAAILMDSRLEMGERVRKAAALVEARRYLIVFDNFESLFPVISSEVRNLDNAARDFSAQNARLEMTGMDAEVRSFFRSLVTAQWRTTALFTSCFACDLFDEVPRGNWVDVPLKGLNQRQALMLMNNLPRLRNAPLADKLAAWNKVGGHPKTIELLEGFLADYSLKEVLKNDKIQAQLTEEWERYFMGALLARLNDAERHALTTASIFDGVFDRAMLAHCGADETMAARWHNLSLVQREADAPDGTARYSLHTVVREFLLRPLSDDERRRLHLHAASFYQERILAPFRRLMPPELLDEYMTAVKMLDVSVQQTQYMEAARRAMELGLVWRYHLFAAGQYEQADLIIEVVCGVLARWGARDLAKRLLEESIETVTGGNKAVALGDLATILKTEGRLDEALAIYQKVYHTFETLGAKTQMAEVMDHISNIYAEKGDYDQAIKHSEAALRIHSKLKDEKNQAICHLGLARLYHSKGDYKSALSHNSETEKIARKLRDGKLVAGALQQRGLDFNKLNRPQKAFECFVESLEISQRIGDRDGIGASLGELGKLLIYFRRMPEAIEALTGALEIAQEEGNPARIALALEHLGVVHEVQEQYAAALEKYEQALQLVQQYGLALATNLEREIARVKGKMGGASADR